MTTPLHEQTMWILAAINGAIFAVIVGPRTFTDEYRHSTIAHTYIADPKRTASTLAKAGAAALSGLLVGAVALAAFVLVAVVMAASSGGEIILRGSDVVPGAGMLAGMALWAVIGAGFGAIVRNQVAVVAARLIWILMLENLGAGLLEDVMHLAIELAVVLGVLALLVAAVETVRARMAGRSIHWWIVLAAGLAGTALLWLWWTHLRFPLSGIRRSSTSRAVAVGAL